MTSPDPELQDEEERSEDIIVSPSETDDMADDTPRVRMTFEIPEGSEVQVIIESLPNEAQTPEAGSTRYEVSFDPERTRLPASIHLGMRRSISTAKSSLSRALGSRLRGALQGFAGMWADLKDSSFYHKLDERIQAFSADTSRRDVTLFALGLAIYALTRLIRLEDFPIYFFTDEAIQTLLSADLIRDGLRGYDGVFLPTYFENASLFNLSLSVYLQGIPYFLFGKSVFLTRAVPAMITLTGAVAIALIAKDIFRIRYWWMGSLFLSITPAWFLHSRTAFETTLFVSMYAWFIYFYLRYRTHHPRNLYLALLVGALAFYSYSAGQLIIVGTGLLLLLTDIRYHWKHRSFGYRGIGLLVILALPYLRFQRQHATEVYFHLRMLDSYLFHDIPLIEKIQTFGANYLQGLSPFYWYFPNEADLPRHLMKGYGHISVLTLPFALVGLVRVIKNLRSEKSRIVLLVLLGAPLGGTVVGVGITRLLATVIPAAILTTLGLAEVGRWIERQFSYATVSTAIFALAGIFNFGMLWDALNNGPTWYDDYVLGGMQYGAIQVFGEVAEILDEDPIVRVYISPTWANGADILHSFFLPLDGRSLVGNAAAWLNERIELNDSILIVLTPEEYDELNLDRKVTNIRVDRTLPYPDGRVGFYFIRMKYSEEAEAIFAAEEYERSQPRTETLRLLDQQVKVEFPFLDMGGINHIFDGDPFTLARTFDANPARFILEFESPILLSGVKATTGSMDFELSVTLFPEDGSVPLVYRQTYVDYPDDPTVDLGFDRPMSGVMKLVIEILSLEPGDHFKIHLRELTPY